MCTVGAQDIPQFLACVRFHCPLVASDPKITHKKTLLEVLQFTVLQGAAERTPQFGRGIASGGERVQWWGACRRTAVYVPFSVYTVAWLGKHPAFIVEEFIKNGGSLVATQRAFRIRFGLVDGRLFLISK